MLVAAKESLCDTWWYTEHGKCFVFIDCFLIVEENLYCLQVLLVSKFKVLTAAARLTYARASTDRYIFKDAFEVI